MKFPKNIKNIIFDLGGVVMDLDIEKTKKSLARLGFNESMFHLQEVPENKNIFILLERGIISETEFYSELKNIIGKPVTSEQLKTAWNEMILGFQPKKIRLLQELKSKYRTFLLSNTNIIHIARCNEILAQKYHLSGLDEMFEKTYYCYKTGLRKPETSIFEYVLHNSSLIPSETLFIDDSLIHLETAEKLGINTFYLTRNAPLILSL